MVSVVAEGFSSCIDKPAMAESTLVRGTDMIVAQCWDQYGMMVREEERRRGRKREGERRGKKRQVTWERGLRV